MTEETSNATYSQHKRGPLFMGLEIGGTNLSAGLLDGESGALLGEGHRSTLLASEAAAREPQAVVDFLVSLGQKVLEEEGLTWDNLVGVGIACPGQITRDIGVVVGASTFPTWSNVPLSQMVQEKTSRPATVLNDATASASAEFAGRGSDETIAVLTLGTGVGLGVVCGGRLMSGSRGLIEGGHMIIEPGPEARTCNCGQRGCLEAYASATAVAKIYGERTRAKAWRRTSLSASPAEEGIVLDDGSVSNLTPTPTRAAPIYPRGGSGVARQGSAAVKDRIRELERRTSLDDKKSPGGGFFVGGVGGGGGAAPPPPPSPSSTPASPQVERQGHAIGKPRPPVPPFDAGSKGSTGENASGRVTAADVFKRADEGDEIAAGVVKETCEYLGLACVNICRLLDPNAILLAGGMSQADGLAEKIQREFASRGWSVLPHECHIGVASACAPCASGVLGAAAAAAYEHAREARREQRRSRTESRSTLRDDHDISSSRDATIEGAGEETEQGREWSIEASILESDQQELLENHAGAIRKEEASGESRPDRKGAGKAGEVGKRGGVAVLTGCVVASVAALSCVILYSRRVGKLGR